MPRRPHMPHEDPEPYEHPTFVRADGLLPRRGPLGRRTAPYEWERVLFWAVIVVSCVPEMVDRYREVLAPAIAPFLQYLAAKVP